MNPMSLSAAASFLLSSLIVVLFHSSAADHFDYDNAVLDVDGEPVYPGEPYYIIPRDGRGLALDQKEYSDPCPLYVIQENKRDADGLPVKFRPTSSRDNVVEVGSDVNIVFDENLEGKCDKLSKVWTVENDDRKPLGRKRYVKIGGKVGNPGIRTLRNWFKIEKVENKKGYYHDYKIVYCPSVCSVCDVDCGSLGVFKRNGKRFVGIDQVEQTLVVEFQRAHTH